MSSIKTILAAGAAVAAFAIGSAAATSASADSTTYVVCNRYNTCWKVQERYKDYPADLGVVYRDQDWWVAHEHDSHWHMEDTVRTEHGWYDQSGNWHSVVTERPQ